MLKSCAVGLRLKFSQLSLLHRALTKVARKTTRSASSTATLDSASFCCGRGRHRWAQDPFWLVDGGGGGVGTRVTSYPFPSLFHQRLSHFQPSVLYLASGQHQPHSRRFSFSQQTQPHSWQNQRGFTIYEAEFAGRAWSTPVRAQRP